MDFDLTERQAFYRDRVRDFIETRIRPRAGEYREQVNAGDRWQPVALIEELKTGRIDAVLDVYEQEPPARDNPLLALDNALCLPHIAGGQRKLVSSMGQFVVDDLQRVMQGQEPIGRITRERFRRQSPR